MNDEDYRDDRSGRSHDLAMRRALIVALIANVIAWSPIVVDLVRSVIKSVY